MIFFFHNSFIINEGAYTSDQMGESLIILPLFMIALPCMLVHINNPSTLEAEIGEGQPRLQTRTVLQNSKQNKEQSKK